nr:unnamed protein product [Callosobruchus analis]
MLIDSIDISSKMDQKKWEAFSRFSYAKFMIENLKDYAGLEKHLTIVRDLSVSEPWVMKILFPDLKDTLFMHVSLLLYRFYIRAARMLENGYPEEAWTFAVLAKKNASAACFKTGEMEASVVKATCEISLNRVKEAISTLTCALTQQISKKCTEGICKVKAYLVKAHLCNHDLDSAYAILNDLREQKTKFDFPIYLAIAYKTLGEYYLQQGASQVADPFITEALLILEEGDSSMVSEIIFMRCLEAITSGLDMMPLLTKHILLAGGRPGPQQQKSILLLLAWKVERRSFWSVDNEADRRKTIMKSRGLLRDVSKPVKPLDLVDPSTKLQHVEKKLAKLLAQHERATIVQLIPPIKATSSFESSDSNSVPEI